jgi:hypothetical protein
MYSWYYPVEMCDYTGIPFRTIASLVATTGRGGLIGNENASHETNCVPHVDVNTSILCLLKRPLKLKSGVTIFDRVCGLVVRVPGCRLRDPGSIPGARFSE